MSPDVLLTPRLSTEERFVEFWLFQFDPDVSPPLELLSQAERKRASRYRSPEKRRQFVSCRSIGRTLFGRLLNLAPAEVEWPATGPPRITRPGESPHYSISVSHTDDVLAFALARLPIQVGIDIEKSTSPLNVAALAQVALTEAEQRVLFNLPPLEQPAHLRQLWTMKEAALKSLDRLDLPGPQEIEFSNFNTPYFYHLIHSNYSPRSLSPDAQEALFSDQVFCFSDDIAGEFQISGSFAVRMPKSAGTPEVPKFAETGIKKVTELENIFPDQKKSKNSVVLERRYRAKI